MTVPGVETFPGTDLYPGGPFASTAEYWSVQDEYTGQDIPLATYAYNIETWGGGRQSPPPPRGADVKVPWIPGQQYVLKVPDSKTLSFSMWVVGCNPDGTAPTNGSQRSTFVRNWQMLRTLLWARQESFTLVKRFFDSQGVLRTVSGTAEFAGGLEPSMTGATRATFQVDLLMADPFFYGDTVTIYFNTLDASAQWNGSVLGDYYTRYCSVQATAGPSGCVNPSVSVSTSPYSTFQVGVSLAPSDLLMVYGDTQQCWWNNRLTASVTHTGLKDWLTLPPGAAQINFDATSGSWSGYLNFVPVYL